MWREGQLVSERVRTVALTAPGGAQWLRALPEQIAELETRWRLTLGKPMQHDGYTAVVLPAGTADGARAVLKLSVPHLEGRDEAAGLRYWDGDPTVRLLRSWQGGGAMLLERCEPGHSLHVLPPEERDDVLGRLVPRLWRRPMGGEFRPLAEQLTYWAGETAEDEARWPDPVLVREGLAAWEELARPGRDDVLLGTDVHAGNVLAAERQPWLIIDPKPFVGDPAYDASTYSIRWSGWRPTPWAWWHVTRACWLYPSSGCGPGPSHAPPPSGATPTRSGPASTLWRGGWRQPDAGAAARGDAGVLRSARPLGWPRRSFRRDSERVAAVRVVAHQLAVTQYQRAPLVAVHQVAGVRGYHHGGAAQVDVVEQL